MYRCSTCQVEIVDCHMCEKAMCIDCENTCLKCGEGSLCIECWEYYHESGECLGDAE